MIALLQRMNETREIFVGCCGARMALALYAERYPALEVQQTFYQPPKTETLERWRTQVPDTFEFSVKAWQLITHRPQSPTYKRLTTKLSESELSECGSLQPSPTVLSAWDRTLACAQALRARTILVQCPASFTPIEENVDNVRAFFSRVDRGNCTLHWEPRGDWPLDLVSELCSELGIYHVVDPFAVECVTPEFPYYRLHGRTGFRYRYEDDELHELTTMFPDTGRSYTFFNNVFMREDALRLLAMLGYSKPHPPTPLFE
jgi:uncharacterized protein YecE (DUF72 family)